MKPLPDPDPPLVICIQVTSLVADQGQPRPVVTAMRASLASGAAVALVGESVRLAGDPSCVIAKTGGGGMVRPVLTVILPLRPATHPFAATVNVTVPSEEVGALLGTVMKSPLLEDPCHRQLAVTAIDPVPPPVVKFCDLGVISKLHTAGA